jgi:hypothetical protein
MSEILLIKLLHVLGFAYWLGADLGVFYTSYYVVNEKLSTDVRLTTAKILFALDQAPRICMTMMLPLGTHLAWKLGALPIDATIMTVIWLLSFGWLAMVITLHFSSNSKMKAGLTSFDFWFRLSLSAGLIGAGAFQIFSDTSTLPYWVAAKFLIFGGLIGCGLIIRIKLRPFGTAFAKLAMGNASDEDNRNIRSSLDATRPFVVTIWIGLIASAALGLHLV